MRSHIERHVKVPTRCIDCAARCSGVARWASPESLSKRAPSTTRTSLRVFRINNLVRATQPQTPNRDRNCDTPPNVLDHLPALAHRLRWWTGALQHKPLDSSMKPGGFPGAGSTEGPRATRGRLMVLRNESDGGLRLQVPIAPHDLELLCRDLLQKQ